MTEPTLFPTAPRFDGPSYDPGRVFDSMRDGSWRTLQELADVTSDPERAG